MCFANFPYYITCPCIFQGLLQNSGRSSPTGSVQSPAETPRRNSSSVSSPANSSPRNRTSTRYLSSRKNRTAYPTFGSPANQLFALQAVHADGNWTTDLTVDQVETTDTGNARQTVITLKDRVYPFTVKLYYKAYNDIDMIETWSEISHTEKKTVVLKRFDSGHFMIRRGDVWISHLHGSWGDEAGVTTEPLTPGIKLIENVDGARNAHADHAEVMFSLDGKPQENEGRVIGAALCWSGNYAIRMATDNNFVHRIFAGIDSETAEYNLAPKEVFATPKLALTYSQEGLSGASRNFHRWARHAGMLCHGDRVRDILLNSWEGVYLDVDEEKMSQMMEDIAAMGGELFVMDDGWFGDKYRRVQDNSSLGDWVVDKKKLPNGLENLVQTAQKNGIKFGIWIEPEAVNSKSELFEKHPEWALQAPDRPLIYGRGGTQLLLDVCNPEVQDFIFGIVDNLLTQHPQIAYIKWDANVELRNYGSTYLPRDKQSHIYIDYHRGLEKIMQRIRAKYPDVVIQACASGGGRANYGVMPYFDEFWVSDNTDALQRIYMQWGSSYFYPSNAMAQHISAAPNHQTGRIIPIKFRCDVAMSGRLGLELQPSKMTEEERAQSTQAIKDYKTVREVIQLPREGTERQDGRPSLLPGRQDVLWPSADEHGHRTASRRRLCQLRAGTDGGVNLPHKHLAGIAPSRPGARAAFQQSPPRAPTSRPTDETGNIKGCAPQTRVHPLMFSYEEKT